MIGAVAAGRRRSADAPPTPLVLFREVLSQSVVGDVTLTTAASGSTAAVAGDQLVCIRMTDAFTDSAELVAPTGTAGTWEQEGSDIASVDNVPRVRVWTRTVSSLGAQTVTCANTGKANHVFLYVLPAGRAINDVQTSYGSTGSPDAARVAPSVTSTTDNTLLICCGTEYDDDDITGFGTLTSDGEIVSNASRAWAGHEQVASGATGTRSVTKVPGSPFWVTASISASLGTATEPEPDASMFPRLGGMLIGSPHNYDESIYRAEIAQLDLAILGMYNGWNGGTAGTSVAAIKALNPYIIIGNYTIMTEVPSDSGNDSTAAAHAKLSSEDGPNGVGDWWAYNSAGQHTDWSDGGYGAWDTNVTLNTTPDSNGDRWPQWKAQHDYDESIVNDGFNVWYCDNSFWKPRSDADWDRSGSNDSQNNETIRNQWRNGQRAYYDRAKALAPTIELWVNADSDLDGNVHPSEAEPFTQFEGVCHGAFIEHAIGKDWSVESWGGWSTMMAWYRALKTNLIGNKTIMFDIYMGDAPTNYQVMRYAFASCLMDDGYFSASTDYNEIRWYDEYDLAGTSNTKWLGTAVDGPQTTAWSLGVYRREFANGLVLVNPKGNGSRTVTIGAGWKKFSGSQAPSVNNGATVTSVTLADRDGLFLVKV